MICASIKLQAMSTYLLIVSNQWTFYKVICQQKTYHYKKVFKNSGENKHSMYAAKNSFFALYTYMFHKY